METSSIDLLRSVLAKPSTLRTYDDILVLKRHIVNTDFFKYHTNDASPRLMDELYRMSVIETYELGNSIFRQGDIADKVYIIISGKVEIRTKQEIEFGNKIESREKVIAELYSGQFFGEQSSETKDSRTGTAQCTSDKCELISLTKDSYLEAMNSIKEANYNNNDMLPTSYIGTKEHIISILSKPRHRRSTEEISIVSTFLANRVPFVQKFDEQQRQELCRVVEIITIYGRSLLFRQGSLGQGFYIVITGTVDVYTRGTEKIQSISRNDPSESGKSGFAVDGLGERVNQLKPGDVFGERALESESAVRMASVVTNDDVTHLAVIAKDDFSNLVSFLMQSDIMEKISILRKTSLFQNVEGIHLRAMAKSMYPRVLHIDEVLYQEGTSLEAVVVIKRGELRATIEVEPTLPLGHQLTKSEARLNLKGRQTVDLGRIAPYSVLGKTTLLCESLQDEKIATETIVATTLVEYYALSKVDFLSHLASESKRALSLAVRTFQVPIIPELWDNGSNVLRDGTWKVKRAWEKYRKDLVINDKQGSDIVKSFRALGPVHLKSIVPEHELDNAYNLNKPQPEKMLQNFYNAKVSNGHSLDQQESVYEYLSPVLSPKVKRNPTTRHVGSDWGTLAALDREKEARIAKAFESNTSGKPKRKQFKQLEDDREVLRALEVGNRRDENRKLNDGNVLAYGLARGLIVKGCGNIMTSPVAAFRPKQCFSLNRSQSLSQSTTQQIKQMSIQQLSFALIHFHRDSLNGRANGAGYGNRRIPTNHLRICGSVATCHDAKELAHLVMKNALLTLFNNSAHREEELWLTWRSFHGFDSLPMQNTDHFLIYCKNTPVEYACISPSKSLLRHEFPSACRAHNQRFAVILTKPIAVSHVQSDTSKQSDTFIEESGSLTRRTANTSTSTPQGASSPSSFANLKPIISFELSSIVEVVLVANTQYECLRYSLIDDEEEDISEYEFQKHDRDLNGAVIFKDDTEERKYKDYKQTIQRGKRLLRQRLANNADLNVNIFPMYEWVILDQQCLEMSQAQRTILPIKETSQVDVKKSTKHNPLQLENMSSNLRESLKESGLLHFSNQSSISSSQIQKIFDKPTSFLSNSKSLRMLEREIEKKDLLHQVSQKQDLPLDIYNNDNQSVGSEPSQVSHNSNGSLASYYRKLLAPREDDLEITRNRLDTLKSLVDARSKIIALSDTVSKTENTIVAAMKTCAADGIPITTVKFRKHNGVEDDADNSSPVDHGNLSRTPSHQFSSNYTPFAQRAKYSASSEDSVTVKKDRDNNAVFTVPENVLRTIEHSTKGKESNLRLLQHDAGLGMGLLKKRSEIYDSLLNVPTLASLTHQKQNKQTEAASESKGIRFDTERKSRLEGKLDILENILNETR